MSATNRGRDRQKDDYYSTPLWCVSALYDHAQIDPAELDPCAGSGALIRGTLDRYPKHKIEGAEKNPERAIYCIKAGLSVSCRDGLKMSWQDKAVIINPPYNDALAWIEKGIAETRQLSALLRLGFLASKGRRPFWLANPPGQIVILSRRPSFFAGKTDAADYAWFIWCKDQPVYSGTKLSFAI